LRKLLRAWPGLPRVLKKKIKKPGKKNSAILLVS
jgi:hypothetical protein